MPARESNAGNAPIEATTKSAPAGATAATRSPRAGTPAYSTPPKQTADSQRAEVLGTLLDGIHEGVAHVSTDGVILYANVAFAHLFGVAGAIEENKTSLRDLMAAECWKDLEEGLKLAAREPMEGSLRVEDADRRTVRAIRLFMTPVHWKKATTIKVTASEMTELLEKNRELQEKEDALHALSARIMQLQDEERRRIARDLHDITGQELAVVIMQLMQVARAQRADSDAMKGITDAASMVKKIEEEIRTLSYVLHPPLLDELGLGAALNWYVEGFSKRSGIEVKVEVAEGFPRLPKEKEIALYRVVQEALTNVMRHSGSRSAQIYLSSNPQTVMLSVRDEGKGIGRKRFAAVKMPPAHGVGIMGMRERLEQLGGGLEVRPLPKGTEVVATMPIAEAAPVERPLTEDEILHMARALGYKEPVAYSAVEAAASGESEHGGTQPAAASAPALTSAAPPAAAESLAPAAHMPKSVATIRKRILVADDHEVTRQGIRSLLHSEADLAICGETTNGLETILKARKLGPDLIVMDLSMPGENGYSAATKIRKLGLHAKILFFTTHERREIERMARLAGFEGLVQKTEAARDLVRGIRAILEGKRFFGGQVLSPEEATKDILPKKEAAGA